jgi:hypothetical protein
MSEQQQTREPKIPGQIGVQELPAAEAPAIYELSGIGLYEFSGANLNESGSELSNVPTPSEFPVPGIPTIGFWENWNDMPVQQQEDKDGKGDPKTLISTSAVPEPVSPSITGSDKATKTSTKDLVKPIARKKSKPGVTTTSNKIVVAVFGLTGTGKSSFISRLTGQDVKIGHGLQSCEHVVDTIYQSR